MSGPLKGARVVEITHVHAGPWGGCLLADMGADVIKVESPGGGDRTRRAGAKRDGIYGYKFMGINRNKKSLALDLSSDAGLEIMYELLGSADVFYNNLSPRTLKKLKLSYEDLTKVNPQIIHCSLSGYGPEGPWSNLYGQDLQIQALCGLASLTGFGDPVSIPAGAPVVDAMTGTLAALAIVSALYYRKETGKGQEIHTSLLAGGLAIQANFLAEYMGGRRMPDRARAGNITGSAPHSMWRCRDGKDLAITGPSDDEGWRKMCDLMGVPEAKTDPRFDVREHRFGHRQEAWEVMVEGFLEHDRDEWVGILRENGFCVVPVLDYEEVSKADHLWETGLLVNVDHPVYGETEQVGCPIKFGESPWSVERGAPVYGEHTREILEELGYDGGRIDELYTDGAVR